MNKYLKQHLEDLSYTEKNKVRNIINAAKDMARSSITFVFYGREYQLEGLDFAEALDCITDFPQKENRFYRQKEDVEEFHNYVLEGLVTAGEKRIKELESALQEVQDKNIHLEKDLARYSEIIAEFSSENQDLKAKIIDLENAASSAEIHVIELRRSRNDLVKRVAALDHLEVLNKMYVKENSELADTLSIIKGMANSNVSPNYVIKRIKETLS